MRNRERLGNIIVAALVPLLFNINILRRTGDYFLKGLYHSSVQKGDTARAKGEFFEAIQHFSVAYDLVQKLTDHKKEEVCLVNLGMLFWNIGEISESSNFFKKAYQASKKAKNNTSISFSKMALTIIELYELGKRLRDSNQEMESLHRFSSAITLAREINASEFELKCLRQQSIVYLQLEEYAAFLDCNEEGKRIAKKLKHQSEEGRCLNNIGIYYEIVSDYSLALKYLEMSLNKLEQTNDSDSIADCLNNLGIVYREIGEFERSINSLKRAFLLDMKSNDFAAAAIAASNIGSAYLERYRITGLKEDLLLAITELEKCISLKEKSKNQQVDIAAYNNVGIAYYEQGDYAEALGYYNKALETTQNGGYYEERSTIYINIAWVYMTLGKLNDAIEYFRKSIRFLSEINKEEYSWEAYYGLGRCFQFSNKVNESIANYQKAISAIDKIRSRISFDLYKIGYYRDKYIVYQHMMDALYQIHLEKKSKDSLRKMFYVAEKAKARAFIESLVEAHVDFDRCLDATELKKEQELSKTISEITMELSNPRIQNKRRITLERSLEKTEENYHKLISKIKIESRAFASDVFFSNYQLPQIKKQLLAKNTVLLDYWLGERRSFLFFISQDEFEIYELPSQQDIEASIRGYLKILSSPGHPESSSFLASKRIANELIGPIRSKLNRGVATIVIVPDGILHSLPFESLRIGQGKSSSYLVEDFIISYSPSATALSYMKSKNAVKKNAKTLLAVGAPQYRAEPFERIMMNYSINKYLGGTFSSGRYGFAPLPFSKKEILDISKYFAKDNCSIYIGKSASESQLKEALKQPYRIIHFACHGFLDEDVPIRSALILSRNSDSLDDGFFQMREIYKMRLNSELVVLSACKTASGRLENVEGLIGMTRTFFLAGARSVLSSLWPVTDYSSSLFMKYFYRFLSEGYTKSQALRFTKIRMLRSSKSHPFYWAGFILSGLHDSVIDFN